MKFRYRFVIALIPLFFFLPQAAFAADEKARASDTMTLYLENDVFGFKNRDRYYTHGTKLSWISRDLTDYRDILPKPPRISRLIKRLPYLNDPKRLCTVVGLAGSEHIHTGE